MCGIAGFTNPDKNAAAQLAAMSETLMHRGPDGDGLQVGAEAAFAHRRLAVIDPDGGDQPRIDPASGDMLVFNGEIYGYRELAQELRQAGVSLQDASDTEVLFWMLRRLGVEGALERLDGMFAFAFFEGATGRLYLVRDRFGEKPLFYAQAGGRLIFASEIKAMRRHPDLARLGLDRAAVHRYLTFEYLAGGESGFENIAKVQPGHLLVYENGEARSQAYWRPRLGGADAGLTEMDAIDRLEELLDRSVRQRLIADVPVGLFLSGGVDSGLLAAMAARHNNSITAYTVKMPDATYDETPHAVAVARHCGIRHELVDLNEADVTSAFHAVTSMIDEPLADYSLLPTYMVCRAARRGLTVALGGDGSDELFAGYASFQARRFAGLMRFLPQAAGRALRQGLRLFSANEGYMSPKFVLRHVSQGFGAVPDHQNYLWMAPFTESDKDRLWRPEARPPVGRNGTFRVVDELMGPDGPQGGVDRLLHQFTTTYLPEDILAKVDRASMMNSLEVRAPFLDRAFAEYALSLPAGWKTRGGQLKRLLKELAARHLPRDVVFRPKHGFGLPLSALLRGPLREAVSDTLLDASNPVAPWFERAQIERTLDEHQTGRMDHRKKIWTLFILFTVAARPA